MRAMNLCLLGLLGIAVASPAAIFTFNTDPFAGSTALTTPGRQVVGGESTINFSIATDLFLLVSPEFGVSSPVQFVNDFAANLPTGGVNVIVLQDTPVPLNAGLAADLIAAQITTPGPGFFVYFNSGLDLPRLVYSTDLNDNTADLKILFRLGNLTGQGGRDALPTFSESNFAFAAVPEPSTALLTAGAFAFLAGWRARRRSRERR
jgi:hypothetical protein